MISNDLRKLGRDLTIDGWVDGGGTCREAAAEIDRLTAEVERLKQQSVDLLGEQLEAK